MKKVKLVVLGIIAMLIVSLSSMNIAKAVAKDFVAYNVNYTELKKWSDSTQYNPTWGAKLRLYMYHVKTSKTDPCKNCKFTVKAYDQDGNMGTGLPFQMGSDQTYPSSAGLGRPATYTLGGTRIDWTLTNYGATINGWFSIDPNN